MAADGRAERALTVPPLAARHRIQHRLHRADRGAVGIADGDGFRGARQAGIGGVHVQIEDGRRIPRHDRPVIPVDIVQPVHQPGDVVKVGHRAFAVAAGLKIHDRRRGPAGAGMHPPPADLDVMHGSMPCSVNVRRVRAITSSTSARGKRRRPSPSTQAPAATARASRLGVICDRPRSSSSCSTSSWICRISTSVSGL
jgi:hypothetical protein